MNRYHLTYGRTHMWNANTCVAANWQEQFPNTVACTSNDEFYAEFSRTDAIAAAQAIRAAGFPAPRLMPVRAA